MGQQQKFSAGMNLPLRSRITCPHCWSEFPPEDVLWVAEHSDLINDPLLGRNAKQRFLPTRFDVMGHAVDVRGISCRHLGCPRCHLSVSHAFMELEPLFLSICGGPSSGKSYFLAAMIWQLRKMLREHFSLDFQSADPVANQVVSQYEEKLFHNANSNELVTLRKTEMEGELYERVSFGDREVWYPRPFVFSLRPSESHPGAGKGLSYSRVLCLYDIAGEHFLPGQETSDHPIQHLAVSQALLFMFDPTQHRAFRERCQGRTKDPQMKPDYMIRHQFHILDETANRIRSHTRLAYNDKYPRPLVVMVSKYDAWSSLLGPARLEPSQIIRNVRPGVSGLDLDALEKTSAAVRKLLSELSPEIVNSAESFAERVIYIPVSALGGSPEEDATNGGLGVRPGKIAPMWVEIPLLYALNQVAPALVRSVARAPATVKMVPAAGAPAPRQAASPAPRPDFGQSARSQPARPAAGSPDRNAGDDDRGVWDPTLKIMKETGS